MSGRGRQTLVIAGLIAGVASTASAQTRRFDFTDAPVSPGWERVTPGLAFAADVGFGFEPPEGGLTLFSLAAPEGDYRVTATPAAGSQPALWAEARRLMIEPNASPSSFTVNVRRPDLPRPPANAPGGARVRLSDAEVASRAWDDRLTLAFDAPLARLEIAPVDVPRLFLLGDSTVADQADGDYASWGQMLPAFLDAGISVANHARSGETLKSFLTALRLDKALSQMRPGDLVLIQFGHNDSKSQWPQTHAEAATTFRSYLRVYVDEVRRRGARPILVTSPHRRTFGPDGRIVNSHGAYPEAVRAVALEQGVSVIDLTEASAVLYEALGPERSALAFADEGRDGTHHNAYGARLLAWAVADGLRDIVGEDSHRRPAIPPLDPAGPPPPEGIYALNAASPVAHRPAGW